LSWEHSAQLPWLHAGKSKYPFVLNMQAVFECWMMRWRSQGFD
jgi:hypothetical protein